MGALIVDDAHGTVHVAHHDHRLAAHMGGEIVAGLPDLALVPDIDPGGVEDALHLEVEDGRIGIEFPAHATGRDALRKVRG